MRLALACLLALSSSPALAQTVDARAPSPAEIDLKSETLTVDHKKHRAVFEGGVVVTRGDLEVRCPTLVAHYDRASKVREVVCEGPVTATQGGRVMTSKAGSFDNTKGLLQLDGETTLVDVDRRFTGERLTYETSTNQAIIAAGQAELPADGASSDLGVGLGSGPLRIRADEVRHDFATRKTTFDGNVVATRSDLTVSAPRLVVVGKEGGELDRAWTEGGTVRVTQGERYGTADRGRFTAGAKRLVLEGNPTVTERGSSLKGERVTFFVGKGRVEVAKPRAVFPLKEAQKRAKQ